MTELPVGLRAEHTIIHPNVNGVTVVLGQERISIGDEMDAQNRVAVSARIEWVHGVHLTPMAAKLLQRQMTEFVTEYERKFGVIPLDLPPEPPKEVSPGVVQLRPPSPIPSNPQASEYEAQMLAAREAIARVPGGLRPPSQGPVLKAGWHQPLPTTMDREAQLPPAFVPVGPQDHHPRSDEVDLLSLVRWWLGSKKPPAA